MNDKITKLIEKELDLYYYQGIKDAAPIMRQFMVGCLFAYDIDSEVKNVVTFKKLVSDMIKDSKDASDIKVKNQNMIKWANILETQAMRIRKAVNSNAKN